MEENGLDAVAAERESVRGSRRLKNYILSETAGNEICERGGFTMARLHTPCRWVGCAIVALLTWACEAERPVSSPVGGRVEVKDSAGIQIVESISPAWGDGQVWSIQEDPLVEIGEIQGEEPYLFEGISGATRLEDGRIVLVEEGSREVRVFDPSGRHLRTFGGAGQGPGEFQYLPDIVVTPSDTLVALDLASFRRSWFTLEGQLIRDETASLSDVPENFSGVGPFERQLFFDGSFLTAGRLPPSGSQWTNIAGGIVSDPAVDELSRSDIRLGIVHADNSETVLGVYPLVRRGFTAGRVRGEGLGVHDAFFPPVLFAIGLEPEAVYIATPGAREVRCFDPDGAIQRILRVAISLDPVAESEITALRRGVQEAAPGAGVSVRQALALFDRIQVPDSVYPYSDLLIDKKGDLWLLRHDRVAEGEDWPFRKVWEVTEGRAEYDVLDPTGRWLGTVSIPRDAGVVREIGADYVLTVRTDEFDVPYLRVYRLSKSE